MRERCPCGVFMDTRYERRKDFLRLKRTLPIALKRMENLKLHTEKRKTGVLQGLFVPLKRHDGKCEGNEDFLRQQNTLSKKI